MGKILRVLLCILITNIASSSYAHKCDNYAFSRNTSYTTCASLPVLNSHHHRNYNSSNGTVDLAFRYTGSNLSQWVAWALNFNGYGMVGAQALVAVTDPNGLVQAYKSAVTGYNTSLQPSPLSFDVPGVTAERVRGDVVIYATLVLPSGGTRFNQVWQVGPVTDGAPGIHGLGADNRNSLGSVDFIYERSKSRQRKRNTHGVLNVISWRVLMPIGVISARYLKVFTVANPAWFYIHATAQTSGYILAVAGWATGLKLGSDSAGITHQSHREIGIVMFSFATLQVFALVLRPETDSKHRFGWNIYHHSIGYLLVILSIINVQKGLNILDPEKKQRDAYNGILIALGVIIGILEAYTWCIVLKRKK